MKVLVKNKVYLKLKFTVFFIHLLHLIFFILLLIDRVIVCIFRALNCTLIHLFSVFFYNVLISIFKMFQKEF